MVGGQAGGGGEREKRDRASGMHTKKTQSGTRQREKIMTFRFEKNATLTHAVTRVPPRERRGFKTAEPEPPAGGSAGSAGRVCRRKVGMQGTPLDTARRMQHTDGATGGGE